MKPLHFKITNSPITNYQWAAVLLILLTLLAACGKKADDSRDAPKDATSSIAEPFSRGPSAPPQVKGPSEPPPPL